MAILTEEMILVKTRCKDMERVRNLNMFGSDLEDVSILKRMQNLEVLSLSCNKISSLHSFTHCIKLQELYLRKNSIVDLHEVHSLRALKYLHSLWLEENACTNSKDYRKFVIYMLPRICKLDGIEISNDEREQAEAAFAEKPTLPVVPTLNIVTNINTVAVKSEIKYTSKPPTRPTNQMPSPRPGMREPSPRPDNRGFESPRIMIGDTPRGPTPGGGNRPQSPYQSAQDSPRQIAALTGETNKHVLTALLSLVKELNLDGLMMLKTDVDSRIRTAVSGGPPSYPTQAYTPTRGGEV
mmetsp:Transcript_82802/g.134270  ORF Transcript_82802/g.134270 Transcript_82802/m.134270 type:complete len:296 (+) Transcript_82802:172-1059(+)|eukprot:CAMPEP_0179413042 /NCGR_PEP_ID=MMETSP0799-20121207/4846_1 /TAXON_ID=46947 /ORGANISM="Geminigera cryophila, Strain CCMP2564" /LENGTH=295 /DNA_ID=CAMNT_0021185405 /DNA_START=164 /DNA_END=1051 /DNA_ORIENTATION=-